MIWLKFMGHTVMFGSANFRSVFLNTWFFWFWCCCLSESNFHFNVFIKPKNAKKSQMYCKLTRPLAIRDEVKCTGIVMRSWWIFGRLNSRRFPIGPNGYWCWNGCSPKKSGLTLCRIRGFDENFWLRFQICNK